MLSSVKLPFALPLAENSLADAAVAASSLTLQQYHNMHAVSDVTPATLQRLPHQ
jgi:hypothetical protein